MHLIPELSLMSVSRGVSRGASEPYQVFKMERFTKMVNGLKSNDAMHGTSFDGCLFM